MNEIKLLECIDLSLTINGHLILDEINWSVFKNQNTVLYGRNGSGKSKLLQCITGYQYPSSGYIMRFGTPHLGSDIRETRKAIGYLGNSLQNRFHPRETALHLVLSGAFATIGLYDEPSAGQKDRAHQLLRSAGLSHRGEFPIETFSDGEKQKLFLARAFMPMPPLLILDEPVANLDLVYREEFLESLDSMIQSGDSTVVYVTHHTEEITPSFASICMLKKGSVFFQGPIEKGLTEVNLTSLYDIPISIEKADGRYYTGIATKADLRNGSSS